MTPANTVFINNWRNRRSPYDEVAPACEAVLCMDFDAKGRWAWTKDEPNSKQHAAAQSTVVLWCRWFGENQGWRSDILSMIYLLDMIYPVLLLQKKNIFGYPNRMCLRMPKPRTLQHQFLVSILAQVFSDFHIRWPGASTAFPHNFLPVQCTQLSKLSLTAFLWLGRWGADLQVLRYGITHVIHQEE